ncbi:MAG: glycosyltransferase [Acidobacteria bacterium]|nr:MAG: glycosyltransferase [Acidobacteriota bacterium]RPJ75588.1 MAG: glycosyltransferase [Acidobacteriota bacterium]
MPTAVLDYEIKGRRPLPVVARRYTQALVVLRWAGRPVGQLVLPLQDGHADQEFVERRLAEAAAWDFWAAWLHDSLGWDEAEPASAPPSATVAVCTRERPEDLARCLGALAALPDDGQEVLVVDNRPETRRTEQVVHGYPGVHYVCQPEGGLNAARNHALRSAGREVVAFTDDDAVVDAGWLRALLRNFSDPRVLCVTGLTMPSELETEAQEIFERYSPFGRGFRRRTFSASEMNPLAVGQVGAGANMALRRSTLQQVGEFDEALDGGTPTRSGGDHEMFSRILAAGFQITYDPAALSWHRHRRSMEELRETLRGYGTGVYAMWTRALLSNRELGGFRLALSWIRHGQLPELVRSLRPSSRRVPLSLLLAEWRGCLGGPAAYLAARRARARRRA